MCKARDSIGRGQLLFSARQSARIIIGFVCAERTGFAHQSPDDMAIIATVLRIEKMVEFLRIECHEPGAALCRGARGSICKVNEYAALVNAGRSHRRVRLRSTARRPVPNHLYEDDVRDKAPILPLWRNQQQISVVH